MASTNETEEEERIVSCRIVSVGGGGGCANLGDEEEEDDVGALENAAAAVVVVAAAKLRREKKSVYWLDPPLPSCPVIPAAPEDDSSNNGGSGCSASYDIRNCSQCHVVLTVRNSRGSNDDEEEEDREEAPIFYIGGFHVLSNCPSVEVHLMGTTPQPPPPPPPRAKDEGAFSSSSVEYLTTVRGIKQRSCTADAASPAPQLFKAICVVPGGPRRVRGVLLKLRWMAPSPTTPTRPTAAAASIPQQENPPLPSIQLHSIRWTLRLPDDPNRTAPTSSSNNVNNNHKNNPPRLDPRATASSQPQGAIPAQQQHQQYQAPAMPPPALQQQQHPIQLPSDLAAAMAGMAFAVQGTEERLATRITACMDEFRVALVQLTNTVQQQSRTIAHLVEENGALRRMVEQQSETMLQRQQQQPDRPANHHEDAAAAAAVHGGTLDLIEEIETAGVAVVVEDENHSTGDDGDPHARTESPVLDAAL
jgi:hypothetical protein